MAGDAVFRFSCNRGNQFNGVRLARIQIPDECDGQEEEKREKGKEAAHEEERMKDKL